MSELNGKYAPRPGFIPGVAINLGGIDFVLAPLGLRLMREFQTKSDEMSKREPAATPEDWYALNVEAIVASLQRNYTDMTAEALDPLLDSTNVQEALKLVLDQTGLKRVKPGELQPVK
jgi:hypothetical protein